VFDNLKNLLKNQYRIQTFIIVIAGILVIYEIISQIFFSQGAGNSILQAIIMLILISIGLVIFYNLPRFDIDYAKYPMIAHKITFSTSSHTGSDGLCCFLTSADKGVPYKREENILLVFGAITKEPGEATIKELLEYTNISIFTTRKKCSNLKFSYQIINDTLCIDFSCIDYNNRPVACQNYPLKNDPACILEKYCTSVWQHVQHFHWASLFFYGIDCKQHPDLEPFAMGLINKGKRTYWIIPIPLKITREVVCKRLEDTQTVISIL